MTDANIPQYSTNSRGAFLVGSHHDATACILGPTTVKIAAIQFNNKTCASLVLIYACHSYSAMSARPEEASLLPPRYEQIGLLGLDGNWLSKRVSES